MVSKCEFCGNRLRDNHLSMKGACLLDDMKDLHVTPMTTCWFYESPRAESRSSLAGVNGFLCLRRACVV